MERNTKCPLGSYVVTCAFIRVGNKTFNRGENVPSSIAKLVRDNPDNLAVWSNVQHSGNVTLDKSWRVVDWTATAPSEPTDEDTECPEGMSPEEYAKFLRIVNH